MTVESKTIVVGNIEIPIKTDLNEQELEEIIELVEEKLRDTSKILDRKKQLILVAMSIAGECIKSRKELLKKEEMCLQVEEKTSNIVSALNEY